MAIYHWRIANRDFSRVVDDCQANCKARCTAEPDIISWPAYMPSLDFLGSYSLYAESNRISSDSFLNGLRRAPQACLAVLSNRVGNASRSFTFPFSSIEPISEQDPPGENETFIPTCTMPLATLPATTVPTPRILYTSWTGIRRAFSTARRGHLSCG